jgi:hypothetical protein
MCCCCGPFDRLSIPLIILCSLNTIFGVTIVLDFFDKIHIYSTADVNKDVTWSFRRRFTALMAWFAIHVMLCLAWVLCTWWRNRKHALWTNRKWASARVRGPREAVLESGVVIIELGEFERR